MHDATLIRPAAGPADGADSLSSMPAELVDQVRARMKMLAMLLFVAFALGLLLFTTAWVVITATDTPLPNEFYRSLPFQYIGLGEAAACLALWLFARNPRVPAARLHTIGLIFLVVLCFAVSIDTYWGVYVFDGKLPNMTWVPAIVIMFPLIMPGPPKRMLGASITAALMGPAALLVLDARDTLPVTLSNYLNELMAAAIAVLFAYYGARIVYGLHRAVAAARDLGSYQLEELLGEGGMGQVWRARHRMLARPAAIKLIRAGHSDAPDRRGDMVRRFEREAQTIASLRSPHTVDLFDFGVARDGAFYYAMELLEGLDADKLVRRHGPMPAERAIHVLRQMCHSLSEADSKGLVHRDIKPANVFLCRYGEECDFVKVLDFGLVKALHTDDDAGLRTGENVVQGTPAFIAPEQALGRPGLDGRVDIYSTGCVAYWLLTGRHVFTADNPMALMMQHASSVPARPSTRTEMPIPEALEALVMECLAKDPAHRPQTARELSTRLGDVRGVPDWTGERARAWWSHHQPAPAAEPEQVPVTA